MSAPQTIARKSTTGTLRVGLILLGAIATSQLIAVGWALASRPPPPAPAADLAGEALDTAISSPPAITPATSGYPAAAPSPEMVALTPAPPSTLPPITPIASPEPIAPEIPLLLLPPDKKITDPRVLEAIADGVTLRNDGDTQGALARLREADLTQPNHPAILYEIGETYEMMGLKQKATATWERIHAMGEAGAGDYFANIVVRLHGNNQGNEPRSAQKVVELGAIATTRDPSAASGERVVIRVPIRRIADVDIHNPSLLFYIFFYDLVNGSRVERSTADSQTAWRSLPMDWEDEEILEAVYHHPELSPDEERELGKREFHGYLIKVYYRDVLQDVIANPRTLVDHLDKIAPSAGEEPTLFDIDE